MSLLSVTVKKARLVGTTQGSQATSQWNSYVTLKLQQIKSTTITVKGSNPNWEQDFLFEINNLDTGLLIEVWSKGLIWDQAVGYHWIHLRDIPPTNMGCCAQWLQLEAELVMRDGEVVGTKIPTGHSVLCEIKFEVPYAELEGDEGVELQRRLEMLNSMMLDQETRQQQYYIQSVSEDSDYTSDVNYPVGQHSQHPNSSASQYLSASLATPQRSLNSSRENSYEKDDYESRNNPAGYQPQPSSYYQHQPRTRNRLLPHTNVIAAQQKQQHQKSYWDDTQSSETDPLYYNSRPQTYKNNSSSQETQQGSSWVDDGYGYTNSSSTGRGGEESFNRQFSNGYQDAQNYSQPSHNYAKRLKNRRGTPSLERQDTITYDEGSGDYIAPLPPSADEPSNTTTGIYTTDKYSSSSNLYQQQSHNQYSNSPIYSNQQSYSSINPKANELQDPYSDYSPAAVVPYDDGSLNQKDVNYSNTYTQYQNDNRLDYNNEWESGQDYSMSMGRDHPTYTTTPTSTTTTASAATTIKHNLFGKKTSTATTTSSSSSLFTTNTIYSSIKKGAAAVLEASHHTKPFTLSSSTSSSSVMPSSSAATAASSSTTAIIKHLPTITTTTAITSSIPTIITEQSDPYYNNQLYDNYNTDVSFYDANATYDQTTYPTSSMITNTSNTSTNNTSINNYTSSYSASTTGTITTAGPSVVPSSIEHYPSSSYDTPSAATDAYEDQTPGYENWQYAGYYDEQGNYIEYSEYYDESGNLIYPPSQYDYGDYGDDYYYGTQPVVSTSSYDYDQSYHDPYHSSSIYTTTTTTLATSLAYSKPSTITTTTAATTKALVSTSGVTSTTSSLNFSKPSLASSSAASHTATAAASEATKKLTQGFSMLKSSFVSFADKTKTNPILKGAGLHLPGSTTGPGQQTSQAKTTQSQSNSTTSIVTTNANNNNNNNVNADYNYSYQSATASVNHSRNSSIDRTNPSTLARRVSFRRQTSTRDDMDGGPIPDHPTDLPGIKGEVNAQNSNSYLTDPNTGQYLNEYGQYEDGYDQYEQYDNDNSGPVQHMDSLESNISDSRDPEANEKFEAEYWEKQKERIADLGAQDSVDYYNYDPYHSKPQLLEPIDSATPPLTPRIQSTKQKLVNGILKNIPGIGVIGSSDSREEQTSRRTSQDDGLLNERGNWYRSDSIDHATLKKDLLREMSVRGESIDRIDEDEYYYDEDEMMMNDPNRKNSSGSLDSNNLPPTSPIHPKPIITDISQIMPKDGVTLDVPVEKDKKTVSFDEEPPKVKIIERITKGMTPKEKWLWSMNRICANLVR